MRLSIVELHKEDCHFSAGHFTIFSKTEREDLHGHNYSVSVALHTRIEKEGLTFDYRVYKKKILALCNQLDRHFLLPQYSPHLRLEETNDLWLAHFNQEKIPFLKRDVIILPIHNVTIEELSHWFLQKLIEDPDALKKHRLEKIQLSVFNGPGQSGSAIWTTSTEGV